MCSRPSSSPLFPVYFVFLTEPTENDRITNQLTNVLLFLLFVWLLCLEACPRKFVPRWCRLFMGISLSRPKTQDLRTARWKSGIIACVTRLPNLYMYAQLSMSNTTDASSQPCAVRTLSHHATCSCCP